MAKQEVIEKVAKLSAPTVGRPKRKASGASTKIQQTCKDCGAAYAANKQPMDDGTTLITPPRCTVCQTAHVTNGRVNKAITSFKHIGNLKSRLTTEQRDAITNVLANELQVLLDVFAGNSISTSGFNLKNIKVIA